MTKNKDTKVDGVNIINGTNGNDIIYGTLGNDELHGGRGNDILYGEGGDDIIYGEDGDDILIGGDGINTLDGGRGSDTVNYLFSSSSVTANLATKISYINSSNYYDKLVNIENISGSRFNDTISGNIGDNILRGFDGDDYINGNEGNDTLVGGLKSDILIGGNGDDTYIYSRGDGYDIIRETSGRNDILNLRDISAKEVMLESVGYNLVVTIAGSAEDKIVIENYFLSSGNRIEKITTKDLDIYPARASIFVNGTSSSEVIDLSGKIGKFIIDGRGGNDEIIGSDGFDTISYASSNKAVKVDLDAGISYDPYSGNNLNKLSSIENINGSSFGDYITGDDQDNNIDGGNGNDFIRGGDGSDYLKGANGRDNIMGDGGDDVLFGDGGDDTLNGGAGSNFLYGGEGNDYIVVGNSDIVTGDGGSDIFYTMLYSSSDIIYSSLIQDFTQGEDTILLGNNYSFDSIKEENIFLNNFFYSPFVVDGKEYKTVEHFYQSRKFSGDQAEAVRITLTPDEAKRLAHEFTFDEIEWALVRDEVMRTGLEMKFNQNPDLRKKHLTKFNFFKIW